jgi:hypothetical protein
VEFKHARVPENEVPLPLLRAFDPSKSARLIKRQSVEEIIQELRCAVAIVVVSVAWWVGAQI